MNDACDSTPEQLCGCCQGTGRETPRPIFNRPGLAQIHYRVGTHASFLASMLDALSDPAFLPLAPLTTRSTDDFTVALLDAWAVSADILTFYQERLANESYLRTAIQQRSVFELARLVGYQPSPGVAASALIAFTLSDAPGSPDSVPVAAGTRVQSTPGPGQSPQVFETSSDLTAYIEHNALAPKTAIPVDFSTITDSVWLAGTATNLKAGDGIVFVSDDRTQNPKSELWEFRIVTRVTTDSANNRTQVAWDVPLWESFRLSSGIRFYAFRKRAALFGNNAPDPRTLSQDILKNYFDSITPPLDWTFSYAGGGRINLDQVYAGVLPSVTKEFDSWIVLSRLPDRNLYRVDTVSESSLKNYTLTSKTTLLTLDTELNLARFVRETRDVVAFVQSELLQVADQPLTDWDLSTTYRLQAELLRPVEGTSLEIAGGDRLADLQPVAINGKRLRLQVTDATNSYFLPADGQNPIPSKVGDVLLVDAFPPIQTAMPASISQPGGPATSTAWSVMNTKGVAGTLYADPSVVLLLPSDKSDPYTGEAAALAQIDKGAAYSTLHFSSPLTRIYDRSTVTVNANVVAATHGQTVHELLGNGDSSTPNQQFMLKQKPLTFVSSPRGQGAQSTLEVWVNDLLWHEAVNFIGRRPAERIFATRTAEDATVTVQFGDGVRGARPPTGSMNIRAAYRKGIGAAGMVDAGQLNQPLDRPQGLKGANNPEAATGGADPATIDDARTSAPLHTLTLGRVVSLEDYENYARAFAGIAKALATWTWFGRTRGIFVTVAGALGAALDPNGKAITDLIASFRLYGSPYVPIQVLSYQPRLFQIGGSVRIDTDNYDPDIVLGNVRAALQQSFSFDQRDLGQGVAQSQVIEIIQGIAGVVAVQLAAFNREDQPQAAGTPLPEFLIASAPQAGARGPVVAAELLLLDVSSLQGLGVWQ
jgi:hypothetical protein